MKTRRCCIFYYMFALCLCLWMSCDDVIPELPPETQEGNNTFGCLINGELIVPVQDASFLGAYRQVPNAVFNQSGDTLIIQGYGQKNQSFTFWIANPQLDTHCIDSLQYVAPGYRYDMELSDIDGIHFSRLDREMRVVSGTFAFQLDTLLRLIGPPLLNVTKGRFDIQINP